MQKFKKKQTRLSKGRGEIIGKKNFQEGTKQSLSLNTNVLRRAHAIEREVFKFELDGGGTEGVLRGSHETEERRSDSWAGNKNLREPGEHGWGRSSDQDGRAQ